MPLNSWIIAISPGVTIDLVEHVGLVGRDDGDAEDLAESGGEDEQPDQRPHQRGDEAFALMHEAQRLAPDDAGQAGRDTAPSRSRAVRLLVLMPTVLGGARAGQRGERRAQVGGPCVGDQSPPRRRRRARGRGAARTTSSSGAISSSRCVAHSTADAALGDQPAHMREDAPISTRHRGRRWVRRAPAGSAGAAARARSRRAASARRRGCAPPRRPARPDRPAASTSRARAARLAAADAVQGRVIEQVLLHRQVEVERARLEHDAEPPQRLARRARDVVALDRDAAVARVEQPGDQREQRRLARAVQPEQRREATAAPPRGSRPDRAGRVP